MRFHGGRGASLFEALGQSLEQETGINSCARTTTELSCPRGRSRPRHRRDHASVAGGQVGIKHCICVRPANDNDRSRHMDKSDIERPRQDVVSL